MSIQNSDDSICEICEDNVVTFREELSLIKLCSFCVESLVEQGIISYKTINYIGVGGHGRLAA